MSQALPTIQPNENHNYVAFFLSLACNLACPYCITLHDGNQRSVQGKRRSMSACEWIDAANRLTLHPDLPLTLQGGEPTLFKGFYRFVNEVKPDITMDLMTNLMFDVRKFIDNVPVWRFTREAPYASIRVSYHPGQNDIKDLIAKTFSLQDAGFRVGIYGIDHPDSAIRDHISRVQEECLALGIDFRMKEFLGEYHGKMYGHFKYTDAVGTRDLASCHCRTTEIIVDPAGYVYRCHSDLYNAREPIAHILEHDFSETAIDEFRECHFYGTCNPCDVKVKTNRFQMFGHTSVEITDISRTPKRRIA